jgi:hypothetical protein
MQPDSSSFIKQFRHRWKDLRQSDSQLAKAFKMTSGEVRRMKAALSGNTSVNPFLQSFFAVGEQSVKLFDVVKTNVLPKKIIRRRSRKVRVALRKGGNMVAGTALAVQKQSRKFIRTVQKKVLPKKSAEKRYQEVTTALRQGGNMVSGAIDVARKESMHLFAKARGQTNISDSTRTNDELLRQLGSEIYDCLALGITDVFENANVKKILDQLYEHNVEVGEL